MGMYFFAGSSLNLTLCMTNLKILVLCLSYFTDSSSVVCLHGSIIPGSLAWKEEEYSIREEVVGV
jgi:hypothetical protein